MVLRCAQAHIILAVILGMMNPKAIGSKRGQINGREIFVLSEKQREIYSGKLCCGGPCDLIGVDILQHMTKDTGQELVDLENVLQ